MNEVDEIPIEIIDDILLRLPVKTLLRLKSVCNSWSRLIGSQYFVDRHLQHERNPERLLYDSVKWGNAPVTGADDVDERAPGADDVDERAPVHIEPPMPKGHTILELVGPVKGIFCAVSHFGVVVLSNPATRELRQLPALLPPHYFDHSLKFLFLFGFGSDPATGDFKLVSLSQRWGKSEHIAGVYNLTRGHSWKPVEDAASVKSMKFAFRSLCSTFLNGVYHWLIELVNDGGHAILPFDMRTDKFQEILQLPHCVTRSYRIKLSVYGESLALLSPENGEGGKSWVDLWVMGRDGFWTKNLTVGPFGHRVSPLCIWNKNEVVLQNYGNEALSLCHVSTLKLRKFGIRSLVSAVYLYKESLVSTIKQREIQLTSAARNHAHM